MSALLLVVALGASPVTVTEKVDLNHASLGQLEALPGIGEKRAEAIISFREHHLFRRTQELLRIKGIGHKLFVRLKPLVIAGDSAFGHAASVGSGPVP
jgi:competence protein ComEA